MENVAIREAPAYEYAVASRALAGERQSGDAALVCARTDGVLVAVVDGLGHGEDAAAAAGVAITTLREHVAQPVATLLQRCHETLQLTRGVAMAVATLETSSATLTWCGVGNVEGLLLTSGHDAPRGKVFLTNRGGVVGYRLPAIAASVVPLFPGDLLIFATDGIDERFVAGAIPHGAPNQMARAILDRHGKATDDSLVLVLRWLGPGAGKSEGVRHER